MKDTHQGQVALSKLLFTQNWEDPAMDEKAMRIKEGDRLFTITSGGCNTLGFLRFSPRQVYCVDINASQTYLMELKQAAFRNLDYDEMTAFLGLQHHPGRYNVLLKLSKDLSAPAASYWKKHTALVRKGIIMGGRFEQFVKIAGWLLRVLQGTTKTKRFFTLQTLEEQRLFYQHEWDSPRWKWIFKTMFNKKRLASKGLDADYFHFDDGSASFHESFRQRARHAMTAFPGKENYFLSLYLLGHYLNPESMPPYLKRENFSLIKSNIDRIIPVTADSKYWLENQPENIFDALSLSNICELMNDSDTHKLFAEVLRTARPDARFVFRNLMIPREVPDDLTTQLVKDTDLSKQLQREDRSFVYSKVAAYRVVKTSL